MHGTWLAVPFHLHHWFKPGFCCVFSKPSNRGAWTPQCRHSVGFVVLRRSLSLPQQAGRQAEPAVTWHKQQWGRCVCVCVSSVSFGGGMGGGGVDAAPHRQPGLALAPLQHGRTCAALYWQFGNLGQSAGHDGFWWRSLQVVWSASREGRGPGGAATGMSTALVQPLPRVCVYYYMICGQAFLHAYAAVACGK